MSFRPVTAYNRYMGQPSERERQEAYVRRWKTLGPILESIRDREIRQRYNVQKPNEQTIYLQSTPPAAH